MPASGLTAAVLRSAEARWKPSWPDDDAPGHGRLHAGAGHHDARAHDLVAVALGHRLRPVEQRLAVLGELRRVEPRLLDVVEIDLGLQAHQVHRDHEELVVVFGIARGFDRERAEVGEIEAGRRDQVVERDDDAVLGHLGAQARRAPAEIGRLAGHRGRQHLGDVLLLRHQLHLDLDALALVGLVEGVDHLGPDLAVGGGEPGPVDDLGGALRARRAAAEPERRARRGRPGRERATGHLPTGRHASLRLSGRAHRPRFRVEVPASFPRRSFHRRQEET